MNKYYYHITREKNMVGILTRGLIPGQGEPLLGEVEFQDFVWLDSSLGNLVNWISTGRFANCVLLRVDSRLLDRSKLAKSGFVVLGKKTWWKYKGIVPPEAIEMIPVGRAGYVATIPLVRAG